MQTILPKKAGQVQPMALDDEHHTMLAADPSIQEFPQGSEYGTATNTSFGGSSTFGPSSTGGFGDSSSSFSSPSFNQQQSSNFGSTQNINQSSGSQPVVTGAAATNAASGADVLVAHDKDSQDWINKKWRPVMGWIYMLTCTADFVVFPILWSLLQAMSKGAVTSQWQPLTLQGAGLYHIAMGAVLGIAVYGRTKEKLESKQ
jgi:hypothetical protein